MDISHSNTTSDTSHDTLSTSPPTAAIAGGVIGALVGLGLVSLFFFLLGRKRRSRGRDTSLIEQEHKNSNIEDIVGLAPSASPTIEEGGLNPFVSSTSVGRAPERRGKRHVEQAPLEVISPITSGGDTQSAMSSHSWVMSPPAYDQVVSC